MITLDFFETISYQFKRFFNDAKDSFIDTINTFHRFLNRFLNDDFILMLLIAGAAILAIIVFRAIINRE